MRRVLLLVLLFSATFSSFGQNTEINLKNLKSSVDTLCSDHLKGRLAFSGYDKIAAEYIEKQLLSYGYEPLWGGSGLVEFTIDKSSASSFFRKYGEGTCDVTYNVVMIKRAKESDGIVLLGAHYDHLGVARGYDEWKQIKTGDIYNGADDNASGIAVMLETARLYALDAENSKRDVIIAGFGAEEIGLVGSTELVNKLNKEGIEIDFMVNIDMVGRAKDCEGFYIFGDDSFRGADKMFEEVANEDNIEFRMESTSECPSDNLPFAFNRTPALTFSTLPHKDYHLPSDDVKYIQWDGVVGITKYIKGLIHYLTTVKKLPKYYEGFEVEGPFKQVRERIK